MGYSGVCFGGAGEGYPLVELLGVDGRADIVSAIGMQYVNRYGKFQGYAQGEWTFGSEVRSEVSSSVGISYGSR